MTVKVVRKVQRSLYPLMLKRSEPEDTCVLCLLPAKVGYEGFTYCIDDAAEKFADDMFHAKVYAKAIGAHS